MPFWHFLYRCPECGKDPVLGDEDAVHCPECAAAFERGKDGAIRILRSGHPPEVRTAASLGHQIEALGGPIPRAVTENGEVQYRSRAVLRRVLREVPLRYRGKLKGFFEVHEEPEEGLLELSDETLTFHPGEGKEQLRWSLIDLRSIQTSSGSVQITPPELEAAVFYFPEDSPRRWEQLLFYAVRRARERAEEEGGMEELQSRTPSR